MNKILSVIECSTAADCVRFEKIIRQAIEEKQVPFFKKLDTTTTVKAQKARLDREAKDEQEFHKDKAQSSSSLAALIQQRNQQRQSKMNSIIDSIETSAKKQGKKRKGPEEDISLPSDEEFMKLQEKLFKKKK